MNLRRLLETSTRTHRRLVAAELGLGSQAGVNEIADALGDGERLGALVESLSAQARSLLGRAAFGGGGVRLNVFWAGGGGAAGELERRGLVFAFEDSWLREYRAPDDLVRPLRRALAAFHARGVTRRERGLRFVGAPLQLAHDAAALSASLQRTPVRVKADGDVYQRDWPKLGEALPPLEGVDGSGFLDGRRVELALDFLRERGLLRVRVDDRPGGGGRRELVPAGDLAETLAADGATLRGELLETRETVSACAGALAEVLAGQAVQLESFGRSLRALLAEAGTGVDREWRDGGLAFLGLSRAWLAGDLELGVDPAGKPQAARFVSAELPAVPAVQPPPAVCQGNFELVLLRPPSPAERHTLELACEREPGQEHVFRLTKASVAAACRAPAGPEGVLGALRALAGELPQNVERSVADWSARARPLRLRSALFLDAGDAATAEELAAGPLSGLVVERLGECLLAVAGTDATAVERALRSAGRSLEPGLDRISGAVRERAPGTSEVERFWRPSGDGGDASRSRGRQTSTLEEGVPDPDGEPREVLERALRAGSDVDIAYVGDRGRTSRRITPIELDASRVRAWCHLRRTTRSFWLGSIEHAVLAA